MIRTPLTFHAPSSLADAAQILAEHAEAAAVLGGGTLLVPMMSRGERHCEHLVDLAGLGLDAITANDEGVRIGARVTYATAIDSELIGEHAALADLARPGARLGLLEDLQLVPGGELTALGLLDQLGVRHPRRRGAPNRKRIIQAASLIGSASPASHVSAWSSSSSRARSPINPDESSA
jgi:FAD binding domain in molybdopterin dehydrogenase